MRHGSSFALRLSDRRVIGLMQELDYDRLVAGVYAKLQPMIAAQTAKPAVPAQQQHTHAQPHNTPHPLREFQVPQHQQFRPRPIQSPAQFHAVGVQGQGETQPYPFDGTGFGQSVFLQRRVAILEQRHTRDLIRAERQRHEDEIRAERDSQDCEMAFQQQYFGSW